MHWCCQLTGCLCTMAGNRRTQQPYHYICVILYMIVKYELHRLPVCTRLNHFKAKSFKKVMCVFYVSSIFLKKPYTQRISLAFRIWFTLEINRLIISLYLRVYLCDELNRHVLFILSPYYVPFYVLQFGVVVVMFHQCFSTKQDTTKSD